MQRLRTEPGFVLSLSYGPLGSWLCANVRHAPEKHRLRWWSLPTGREFEVEKIPQIKGKAATGLRSFARIMTDLQKHVEDPPDEVIRQVITFD